MQSGHDGLQIERDDVHVTQSLFEDINDEGIKFLRGANTRIDHNILRQTLNPLSFNERSGDCGSVYISRNIIDQRVPVRGYRVLPDDAPDALVWRHGADFKMENADATHAMPDVAVFQNTFIRSHDDEGALLSSFLDKIDKHPSSNRFFLNNIVLGISTAQTLPRTEQRMAGPGDCTARQAAATLGERSVMGNLWYRFHAAKPTDNLDSLNPYGNPVFRNFDDEILSYGYYLGQPYPNNDFRPFHLGPAAHRGVPLPLELASRLPPDDPAIGNSTPDMGAQPVGAAPFVAGANNAVEFPLSDFPIARARREGTLLGNLFDDGILPITITDTGDDGFERVKVNATQSKVPAADTPSFKWLEAGVTLASTPVAGLYLSEGAHYLDLSVQTGPNKFDTDGLRINVVANRPHGDNLLECPGFEQIDCAWTLEMAGFSGSANAHTGKRAVRIGPAPGSSARQRVNVSPNTTYRVTGWVRRDGLPSQARVRINVFDAAGNGVDAIVTGIDCSPEECVWPTANAYSYHEASVTIPSTGVAMELRLKAQPSRVIFDDLRVLSSSIIDNYGFERRSPSGFEAESVNWILSDGARIVADPENARSGRRALQLKGGTDTLVTRHINLPFDAAKLRISGWIKTVGTIMPPNVQVQFGAGTSWISVFGTQVLQTDGVYKFFEGCVVQPAATKELNFRLKLLGSAVSSAYFDDILIEQTDC